MSWLSRLSPSTLGRLMNLWPPYLGAGISVRRISNDWRSATVTMTLRFYNKNLFGTHFGGSLYSMTDPFFAILIFGNLGAGYRVWDIASSIEFIKPGKGRVSAEFSIDDELIETVRRATEGGGRHICSLAVDITDERQELVAKVNKKVYVRRVAP
jgi:acyl-coenzyme A thioesterase PaaI-like protein